MQPFSDVFRVAAADRRYRPGPEDLADHRRILEQRLPVRGQRVDARRDQRLNGFGHGDLEALRQIDDGLALLDQSAIGEHPGELLGVKRVASCSLEEGGLRRGRQDRLREQGRHEPRRVVGREWRERDRRGVALAARPAGLCVVELRPRRADDQQRHPGCVVDEMFDEPSHRGVRPVQVLDDQDERILRGGGLDEAKPGRECLRSISCRAGGGFTSNQWREPGREPVSFLTLDQILDRGRELA